VALAVQLGVDLTSPVHGVVVGVYLVDLGGGDLIGA
jgi:hypothetical protein